MQEFSSKDSIPFNEEYALGEQYNMGALKAAYYITYTNKDAHQYRIHILLFIIAIMNLFIIAIMNVIGALIHIGFAGFAIFNWQTIHYAFYPFYLFCLLPSTFILLYIILLYSRNAQKKYGNRPKISPRDRHLRVYVYQNGLIKQTDKSCDIVRWPELAGVTSIPYVPPSSNPKFIQGQKPAGIKLELRNRRKLRLNGALVHADELTELLKYMSSNYNSVAV